MTSKYLSIPIIVEPRSSGSEFSATFGIEEVVSFDESEPLATSSSDWEESPLPTQPESPIPKHQFEGHCKTVWDFVFLHDDIHIVSGSDDGTMRKWNYNTGLLVGEPWKGKGGKVYALVLSPDGKTIACGRSDGSVQQWNTDGKMIKDAWTGHNQIWSLSWSPSGDHIVSGSSNGTIFIQRAETGETEADTIKSKQNGVSALAYSPSGDRIASGGYNNTICIWDSKTRELVVGPIEDQLGSGPYVSSVVWSSNSAKLYSASTKFVRVFDSVTGAELQDPFEHDHLLNSVALSSKNNVLACVGYGGVAQLWDTKSQRRVGHSFAQQDRENLCCVSFSQDGRSLAYGGNRNKITLWLVKDIAPELPSPSPSCLDVDITGGKGNGEERDDPYEDFFQSYHQYRSSAPSGSSYRPRRPLPPFTLRFWNILIPRQRCPTAREPITKQRPKRSLFARDTGPRPVTVSAGRKKQRRWIVRHPESTTNAQTGQSSTTAQPGSAAQPPLMSQLRPPQTPTATQQPAQEDGYDYGCWGNFCLALWCIPRRPLRIISSAQPVAS